MSPRTPRTRSRKLGRAPSIDVLVVNGVNEFERASLLAAACERNVWCVHLRAAQAHTDELPPIQRAKFIAALPLDAAGTRIASTIRALIAARRSKTAG